MTLPTTEIVDLRSLSPGAQENRVVLALDAMGEGPGFEVVSDRDARAVLLALQKRRPGRFEWSPLEEGPRTWRVLVSFRNGDDRSVCAYLHWDHRRLDGLLEAARSLLEGGSSERAALRFFEFKAGLLRHIRMEEEVLFPAFERATGMGRQGPTLVMRAEHVEIVGLLESMSLCMFMPDPDSARFEELRMALLSVLGEHNEKEEHVVYPLTDRALLPDERDDLVLRMQAV